MKILVLPEDEPGPDKDAMKCVLQSMEDMLERYRCQVMSSKSSRKVYRMEDKAGQQIGRVQYFLSILFKELVTTGRVQEIYG